MNNNTCCIQFCYIILCSKLFKIKKEVKLKTRNKTGLTVYINTPQMFERSLNKFKRIIKQNKILETLKESSYYVKPSIKKKRKKQLGKLKQFYKQKQ